MATCSVPGCMNVIRCRGWCNKHYKRWERFGDPLHLTPFMLNKTEAQRFWSKVQRSDGCWIWQAGLTGSGYGLFALDERKANGRHVFVGAHRYAYEALIGPISEGLHIDHLCRVPACVNPTHLEPVTPRTNSLRGVGPSAIAARRSHCVHGHEFTPENTWVDPRGADVPDGVPVSAHLCHARGCTIEVPPRMFMCRPHWYMVPKPLRDRLWAAYVPGQERHKDPTDEYLDVAMECVEVVFGKEVAVKEGPR